MKLILSSLAFATLLASCTQKYQTFHIIEKSNFDKENYQAPIAPKLLPGKMSKASHCEGQFFFSSNAKKKTDLYTGQLVRTICPENSYLLKSRLTETWWTTIIYSRSCVELETYCPTKKQY